MDAADRRNNLTQSVIGAKEGATEAITELVGRRVTDTVLRTADGADYKSVDEYELHQLISAIMQAADRPKPKEVRRQLAAAITASFNFRQRFSDNVAAPRAKFARLAAYGININEEIIAAITIAEATAAARQPWGREIETAVAKLRLQFGYDYAHTAGSLAIILKELALADGSW